MITFKKNSWHYRFNKWVAKSESGPWINVTGCKSICPYFWDTVWNIIWVFIFTVILYLILSMLGASVLSVEYPTFEDFSWLWLVGLGTIVVLALVCLIVVLVCYFSVEYTKKGYNKVFSENKEGESEEYKEPNVFIEWIKAKKAKVCPMIEFKD